MLDYQLNDAYTNTKKINYSKATAKMSPLKLVSSLGFFLENIKNKTELKKSILCPNSKLTSSSA